MQQRRCRRRARPEAFFRLYDPWSPASISLLLRRRRLVSTGRERFKNYTRRILQAKRPDSDVSVNLGVDFPRDKLQIRLTPP
jgi:hypothetical protein